MRRRKRGLYTGLELLMWTALCIIAFLWGMYSGHGPDVSLQGHGGFDKSPVSPGVRCTHWQTHEQVQVPTGLVLGSYEWCQGYEADVSGTAL